LQGSPLFHLIEKPEDVYIQYDHHVLLVKAEDTDAPGYYGEQHHDHGHFKDLFVDKPEV